MRPVWRVLCGALLAFAATVADVGGIERMAAGAGLLALLLARPRHGVLLLAGALLGAIGAARIHFDVDRAAIWADRETSALVRFEAPRDASRWDVVLAHPEAPAVRARLRRVPDGVRSGDLWRMTVDTAALPRTRNPDDRRALRARLAGGALISARVTSEGEGLSAGEGPGTGIRWRDAAARRWDETLQGSSALWRALLLADRRGLHPAATDRVRELGFAHLLALSGLHVGVVVGVLAWGLSRWGRGALLSAVPILLVWTWLAGGGPSMVRAVVMVSLIALGRWRRRHVTIEDVLAACACLEIAVRPQVLGGIGWWLSYAATLAIVRALPILAGRPRIVQGLGVSVVAQLGTLPWILDAFGRLPVLSAVVLLVVGPVFTVVLALGGAAAALALLGVPGAAPLASLGAHVFGVLLWWAEPTGAVALAHPGMSDAAWALALAMVAAFLVPHRPFRARHLAVGAAVALVAIHVSAVHGDHHAWISFDVGQGDGGLYRCGERTVIVDTGPGSGDWRPVERSLLPYVERRNLRALEIVLTHRHADHVAGTRRLVRTGRVAVLAMARLDREEQWARRFAALADSHGATVRWLARGDRLWDDCCRPEVLWPPPGRQWSARLHDANDRSIVLALGPHPHRLLTTGDLERHGEREVLGALRDRGEEWILKVAHHGGDTGTDRPLLERMRPRWGIVSCGQDNRYGHPKPALLERLEAAGVEVLRTDRHGAVILRWGADGPALTTAGGGP